MVQVLCESRDTEVAGRVEAEDLWLAPDAAERATGWTLKPEGLCREEVCVPVPRGREGAFVRDGAVNIAGFWRHMGRPLARDADGEVWVLGASARERAQALESLQAPDFSLPDLDGRLHRLSDHRGRKVLLTTWASW
jgi:hypothetical protein